MPRLWDDTIAAHREAVREAILDTTRRLVSEQGPLSVTMSQIAEDAGIGRATLYKYFADVEDILLAWHERTVASHLAHLTGLSDGPGSTHDRLRAVLERYAAIVHQQGTHGGDLAQLLHRKDHVAPAQRELDHLLARLIADAATEGGVRDDVPPPELASYCLHALAAARDAPSPAAVHRLVRVTLAALRPKT